MHNQFVPGYFFSANAQKPGRRLPCSQTNFSAHALYCLGIFTGVNEAYYRVVTPITLQVHFLQKLHSFKADNILLLMIKMDGGYSTLSFLLTPLSSLMLRSAPLPIRYSTILKLSPFSTACRFTAATCKGVI